MKNTKNSNLGRRDFFKILTLSGIGAAIMPSFTKKSFGNSSLQSAKPETNIGDALSHPRNNNSLPGKFPSRVVRVIDDTSFSEGKINGIAVNEMLAKGMLALTGASTITEAWLQFVKPGDRIGYDVVIKKRIEMGVQESETDGGKEFMVMASQYQLGEHDIDKIDLQTVNLS